MTPFSTLKLKLHDGGTGVDLARLKRAKAVDTSIGGVRVEHLRVK